MSEKAGVQLLSDQELIGAYEKAISDREQYYYELSTMDESVVESPRIDYEASEIERHIEFLGDEIMRRGIKIDATEIPARVRGSACDSLEQAIPGPEEDPEPTLLDLLTTIRLETQPCDDHSDPGAIQDLWAEVFGRVGDMDRADLETINTQARTIYNLQRALSHMAEIKQKLEAHQAAASDQAQPAPAKVRNMRCGNCQFFDLRELDTFGECRRRAPRPGVSHDSRWIAVRKSDWCGEFEMNQDRVAIGRKNRPRQFVDDMHRPIGDKND